MAGGTGAPPVIAKLREATDKAKQKAEGDEATGAASSPLVFLLFKKALQAHQQHSSRLSRQFHRRIQARPDFLAG